MILKDFSPSLVGELKFSEDSLKVVTKTSILAWTCPIGHMYYSDISRRIAGAGCHYCSGHLIYPVSADERVKSFQGSDPSITRTDLWATRPDVAKSLAVPEFGFYVTNSSLQSAAFVCEEGHGYNHVIKNATGRCMVCEGYIFNPHKSISNTHKKLVESLVDPRDSEVVNPYNAYNLELKCQNGHRYFQKINAKISRDLGCTICAGYPYMPKDRRLCVTFEEKNRSYEGKSPDQARRDIWATHPELAIRFRYQHLAFFKHINSLYPVEFLCDQGHYFTERPLKLAEKFTCPYCDGLQIHPSRFNSIANLKKEYSENLLEKADADVITINSCVDLNWSCIKGHRFTMTAKRRLEKSLDCSKCIRESKSSRLEIEVFRYLRDELRIKNVKLRDRKILAGRELDIYLKDYKIAIEVNGDYWHSEKITKEVYGISAIERHRKKLEDCEAAGISLIFIWEFQWKKDKDNCRGLIKSMLLSGITPEDFKMLTLPEELEAIYSKSRPHK